MASTSRAPSNRCQKIFAWPSYAIGLLLLLAGAAVARAGELAPGGTAIVTSVIDGDTVLLDREIDGSREVRLVGLQAPKLPLGRKGFRQWPFADEAKTALETLVRGRTVELGFGGLRMDRHRRLLAHLTRDDGVWVQGAMLDAGLARVYSFADNRARVPEMLARERAARADWRGIWQHPFYAIRDPETVAAHVNSFELVEGPVRDVGLVSGRAYLNFGDNWRTDFTVRLAAKIVRQFTQEGVPPESYKGRRIRVRGWIQSRDGPMIEATHPDQIEVLDP